jgi:RimJ/RimL family protein N-acetyltransferase
VRAEDWQIDPDASDEVACEALAGDRIWNAFAIADLEPPFRAYSRIAVARRPGTDQVATCLMIQTPDFSVVVPYGEPTGVAAILATVNLPATAGVMVQPEHEEAVDRWYDFPRGRKLMVRMATDAANFRDVPPTSGLVRLHPPDLEELLELYTNYPANHFVPIQIEHGVYFGVRKDGHLVAAGGTHVLAPKYGIATLGGIFTLPEMRGRGYASSVTSALVAELLALGCRDVALTVYAENDIAQRVYARLGFREHCQYETGDGVLRGVYVAQPPSSQI